MPLTKLFGKARRADTTLIEGSVALSQRPVLCDTRSLRKSRLGHPGDTALHKDTVRDELPPYARAVVFLRSVLIGDNPWPVPSRATGPNVLARISINPGTKAITGWRQDRFPWRRHSIF